MVAKNHHTHHHQQQQQPQPPSGDGDPLDRMLFIHSHISSLLRQIDELVVQAVNGEITDDEKKEEIRTFTDVLFEIHTSLKPWVPRLQKVLGVPYIDLDAQMDGMTVGGSIEEVEEQEVDTPEPIKQHSLVSPSPLVSWRAADCTIERGKQLFLLTPVPRPNRTCSKSVASAKPTNCKMITSQTAAKVSSLGNNGKFNEDKCQADKENVESTSELQFASPFKFSSNLMTPSLKISPPRSCVVQEPNHEFVYRKIDQYHKSTPFPVGNTYNSTDSESSSGEISEKLGLKYPELIGIKPSCTVKNTSRMVEASPAWMRSPPKCCTLLEPLEEKSMKSNAPLDGCLQDLASKFNEQMSFALPKGSIAQVNNHDHESKNGNLTLVESTPLWKGCESTINRGRRAGENTLKRELWTRFEAATTEGICLNLSNFQDTSHKGFLDKLEEVSCDEASPHPNSLT